MRRELKVHLGVLRRQGDGPAANLMRRELKAPRRLPSLPSVTVMESHEERIERLWLITLACGLMRGLMNLMRRELKDHRRRKRNPRDAAERIS